VPRGLPQARGPDPGERIRARREGCWRRRLVEDVAAGDQDTVRQPRRERGEAPEDFLKQRRRLRAGSDRRERFPERGKLRDAL
jgi:hypothetical protein